MQGWTTFLSGVQVLATPTCHHQLHSKVISRVLIYTDQKRSTGKIIIKNNSRWINKADEIFLTWMCVLATNKTTGGAGRSLTNASKRHVYSSSLCKSEMFNMKHYG